MQYKVRFEFSTASHPETFNTAERDVSVPYGFAGKELTKRIEEEVRRHADGIATIRGLEIVGG